MRPKFDLGLGTPASRVPTYIGYLRSPSVQVSVARWRGSALGLIGRANFQEAVGASSESRAQRLRCECGVY